MKISIVILLISFLSFTQGNLVNVDFYVMSKCPDAAACEIYFKDVIPSVSSIMNLTLNHIATETSPGKFSCMHGPSECTGDIQQQCVWALFGSSPSPTTGAFNFFDFAVCQSETRSQIPANGDQCAKSLGLNVDRLDHCVNGELGKQLMEATIKRTQAADVSVSCTININDSLWCQHNGDWENCPSDNPTPEDFVAAVCEAYTGPNPPAACKTAPLLAANYL